jgi:zinc/manganese transport system substrate-binding protein
MKKILIIIVLLGLALPAQAEVINVVTTTTDLKSVVEYIGGDKVKVYSLGKGNQNYHFLQAKPSYMIKAKKADLFIRVGLELEVGYESLILEGSRNRNIQIERDGHLDASIGIKPLDVHTKVDRSMGDIHASGNPHFWLDPLNMKIVASNITNRLVKFSPLHKSFFENNLSEFNALIDSKMIEWKETLFPYVGEKLITYHKSWPYFTNRFGFEIVKELEPKPGVPPSPTHLKRVIDIVKQQNVKVILLESIYKKNAAQYVADRTGSYVVVAPISVGGINEATDYFTLMDTIIKKLKEGFEGE